MGKRERERKREKKREEKKERGEIKKKNKRREEEKKYCMQIFQHAADENKMLDTTYEYMNRGMQIKLMKE